MKNMKKILAVGALLTLGTMVSAELTNSDTFNVNLTVVAPLTIDVTQDVDFGSLNLNDMPATVEAAQKGRFTVAGGRDLAIKFTVQQNAVLTGPGSDIDLTAVVQDENEGDISGNIASIESNGTYLGYLDVSFASSQIDKIGIYSGTIDLQVDYN